jgi:3-oxoacyl-[acyl-carrier protein] reductase
MPNLSGKTALVTGASRGIGRASALALAAAGAQVLVHYGRGATEADGVVAEIRKGGSRADAVAADLSAADGPHKLAKLTRNVVGDRLDILVANAGISKDATIEETTVEDFDKLFAVNVRAPFFLVQQLLPIMSIGSSIVLVSSLGARAVVGTIPAYAATKGAVDTLVKHFASLLGARGIRVNAVAPGVVETDMSNLPRLKRARSLCSACRRLRALRSLTISVASSPSWHPKMPGGSPASRYTSMAARSSKPPSTRGRLCHGQGRAFIRNLSRGRAAGPRTVLPRPAHQPVSLGQRGRRPLGSYGVDGADSRLVEPERHSGGDWRQVCRSGCGRGGSF